MKDIECNKNNYLPVLRGTVGLLGFYYQNPFGFFFVIDLITLSHG
jgi:hypothetical protein